MKINLFAPEVYKARRNKLVQTLGSGKLLFLGNDYSPMNYKDNYYPFRQDSCFLYYFGLNVAGLNAIIDIDNHESIIFGDELIMDDIVWTGPLPSIQEMAQLVGIKNIKPSSDLGKHVDINTHYLPPYRHRHTIQLSELTGRSNAEVKTQHSMEMIRAIISQRNIKSEEEIQQMDQASTITANMHHYVMAHAQAGLYEYELAGLAKQAVAQQNSQLSFPPILTKNGHILHNHSYDNIISDGDLILFDGGCTSPLNYAGDMTRTYPANGKFTDQQRLIYNIVLQAQESASEMLKPGIKYMDIHMHASHVIAEGLKAIGVMKGNLDDAVDKGAHALFFQHGLGHMIGLDVHDMENLGEQLVGYESDQMRSKLFGIKSLRLARTLEVGHAVTVEPGIYFIPMLIEKWRAQNMFMEYINYDELEHFMNFGGIRIEDDLVVTESGPKLLGTPLAKSIAEVEAVMAAEK